MSDKPQHQCGELTPTTFWACNTSLSAPGCRDLPAARCTDQNGKCRIISCWRLTLGQRIKVLFSGRIWLDVWGQHPPVCLFSNSPFERQPGVAGRWIRCMLACWWSGHKWNALHGQVSKCQRCGAIRVSRT